MNNRYLSIGIAAAAAIGCAQSTFAATRCVKPGGGAGCYSTITAAVAAAAPGDIIYVEHGTYTEDVVIPKPVTLVGENRSNTIIDASGLPNGINIDGFDHTGLSNVSVSHFTIENASTEGILVSNASRVTLFDNHVSGNDRVLANGTCSMFVPPDNPPGEGFDCGEAIHLTGVDHSTVSASLVEGNSGGILISDDSGPTHDNLISGNDVVDNEYDCGITLASHNPNAPNGVFHNTITGNLSARNGHNGEGAGVGLFTPAPGTATYGNIVVGNRLIGNRLPGVAMHSHAPGQDLNDNQIVANYIADNGADTDDAATPGATGINVFGVTPITGTMISDNVIEREDVGIAVKTGSEVAAHFNNLLNHRIGVANLGSGAVDATNNWWGCPAGPQGQGCSTIQGPDVTFAPWLTHPVTIVPPQAR